MKSIFITPEQGMGSRVGQVRNVTYVTGSIVPHDDRGARHAALLNAQPH